MTVADFRRIALSLEGVEEYFHTGLPAFRVGGRKFASLASQAGGTENLMLTLEQQAALAEEAPEIFLPIPGGWERWDARIFAWRRGSMYGRAHSEPRGGSELRRTQSQAGEVTVWRRAAADKKRSKQ